MGFPAWCGRVLKDAAVKERMLSEENEVSGKHTFAPSSSSSSFRLEAEMSGVGALNRRGWTHQGRAELI